MLVDVLFAEVIINRLVDFLRLENTYENSS
jgi:hypothetical protein